MKLVKRCSLPNCEENAKISGMCLACYSWWNRVKYYNANELSAYLTRNTRKAKRMLGRYSVTMKRKAA